MEIYLIRYTSGMTCYTYVHQQGVYYYIATLGIWEKSSLRMFDVKRMSAVRFTNIKFKK